ncbi:MAG: hypothetical protein Q8P28_02935 [Deltaproteobacteria bacterium]|nr:hypothetical protein [Deltaproteobacteria bacterium]
MKRFLLLSALSLVFAITAYLYPWAGLKIIPDAFATGGAFINTKHGGGTTDGLTPCAGGVNRGLGADYEGLTADPCNTLPGTNPYNSTNPEAGTYGSGECLHCHEPMGSFGGSEPHPNTSSTPADTAGPSPYLLFKGDYNSATTNGASAELCWYCHQNQVNINNSNSPRSMGRWSFYQGKTIFQASSHFLPPFDPQFATGQFYWPGTTGDPVQIWPRQNRSGLPTGNKGSCLNCHTPHGIKAANAANAYDTTAPDGTGGVPATKQIPCADPNILNNPIGCNPSVMSDYMIPRKLIAWEENLCEACHSGPGPSTKDIREEINKRHPVGGAGSGHPIDDTALSGRHTVRESIPLTLTEGSRLVTEKHVECYDCHNPHAVKLGGNDPLLWDDGGRLKGIRYITLGGGTLALPGTICDPVSSTNPAECTTFNGFTKTSAQPFIYELCFKCHGDPYASFVPDRPCSPACPDNNPLRTTVAQNGCTTRTPASSCTDGSNKRLEFNPLTQANDGFGGTLAGNRAYHPVAVPGRNTSRALCLQLKTKQNGSVVGGFAGLDCTSAAAATASLSNLTIYCTDCHNNDAAGAGNFTGLTATPTYPGPVTESSLRSTDKASAFNLPATPVGPHGSVNPRILRAQYNTGFTCPDGTGALGSKCTQGFNAANFALCFQCHNIDPFVRTDGTVLDPVTNTRIVATNFFNASLGSLHEWHLIRKTNSSCINCHYNIHSNYEQAHTQLGTATGGVDLPPDGDTHLINFSPAVTANGLAKPAWYYRGGNMGCTVTCHGIKMDGAGIGGGGRNAIYVFNPS